MLRCENDHKNEQDVQIFRKIILKLPSKNPDTKYLISLQSTFFPKKPLHAFKDYNL
jgi:hypothetical protein